MPGPLLSAEQRRADALGLVAESALAAGLDPGTRGDRYQVVVHVEAETLAAASDGPGMSMLEEEGTGVSAETSRRLACEASRVVVTHDAAGRVLDVGRRTRTVSPALRRALTVRDGGCRFPGCGLGLCDAHHVEHWADGGETNLENLVLLCRRHHRAVHEEGFRVELAPDGEATFYRPDGRLVPQAPRLPRLRCKPRETLQRRLAAAGVAIDPEASLPSWTGGAVDYGWAVESLI